MGNWDSSRKSGKPEVPDPIEMGNNKDIDGLITVLSYKGPNQLGIHMTAEEILKELSKKGDNRVTKDLISNLKKEDDDVRNKAAQILCEMEDERAIKPLIKAVYDEPKYWKKPNDPKINIYIPGRVATYFGDIKDSRGIKPLLYVVKHREKYPKMERYQAAKHLGRIGNKKAIEHLIKLLEEEIEPSVKTEIVDIILILT